MTRTFESRSDVNERPSFAALPMVPVLVAVIVAFSTVTAAQNDGRVKAGLTTWKTAGCVDCHGPFADGNQDDDDFPAGADLRTTRLDAAAIKLTIRCGRAGTGMPSFDEGAYTVRGRSSSGRSTRRSSTDASSAVPR